MSVSQSFALIESYIKRTYSAWLSKIFSADQNHTSCIFIHDESKVS